MANWGQRDVARDIARRTADANVRKRIIREKALYWVGGTLLILFVAWVLGIKA